MWSVEMTTTVFFCAAGAVQAIVSSFGDLDAAALALGQPSEILHRRFIVDQRLHAPRAAERLQRPQRLHDRQRAGIPHRIDPDHDPSSFVLLSGI